MSRSASKLAHLAAERVPLDVGSRRGRGGRGRARSSRRTCRRSARRTSGAPRRARRAASGGRSRSTRRRGRSARRGPRAAPAGAPRPARRRGAAAPPRARGSSPARRGRRSEAACSTARSVERLLGGAVAGRRARAATIRKPVNGEDERRHPAVEGRHDAGEPRRESAARPRAHSVAKCAEARSSAIDAKHRPARPLRRVPDRHVDERDDAHERPARVAGMPPVEERTADQQAGCEVVPEGGRPVEPRCPTTRYTSPTKSVTTADQLPPPEMRSVTKSQPTRTPTSVMSGKRNRRPSSADRGEHEQIEREPRDGEAVERRAPGADVVEPAEPVPERADEHGPRDDRREREDAGRKPAAAPLVAEREPVEDDEHEQRPERRTRRRRTATRGIRARRAQRRGRSGRPHR